MLTFKFGARLIERKKKETLTMNCCPNNSINVGKRISH
jgi:hypothetical protein